jgi:hypothetical protein
MDYFCFQRKAISEIRLLALLQGISLTEARQRLYQPEADPEGDAWNYVLTEPTPPPSAPTSPEPVVQRKSMKQGSNTTAARPQSTLSLDIESTKAVAIAGEMLPFNSPMPRSQSQSYSYGGRFLSGSLSLSSHGALSWEELLTENEQFSDLHLCVPLTERLPLIEREKVSSGKKMKGKKGIASKASGSLSLVLAVLALVMLFVGYAIMTGNQSLLLSPHHLLYGM